MGCLLPAGELRRSWLFLHEEREYIYIKRAESFAIRVAAVLKIVHYFAKAFRRARAGFVNTASNQARGSTVAEPINIWEKVCSSANLHFQHERLRRR